MIYTCNYSGTDRMWGGLEAVFYVEQVFSYCSRNCVAAWCYDNFRQVSWGYILPGTMPIVGLPNDEISRQKRNAW